MALHLPIGPFITRSGLEPVQRCEPSYLPSPLADGTAAAPSGPVHYIDIPVVQQYIGRRAVGGGGGGGGGGRGTGSCPQRFSYFKIILILNYFFCWVRNYF